MPTWTRGLVPVATGQAVTLRTSGQIPAVPCGGVTCMRAVTGGGVACHCTVTGTQSPVTPRMTERTRTAV